MNTPELIPVSSPLFGKKEKDLLLECIKSGWISSQGKYLKEFEKLLSDYCFMPYGIAVTSGTAALQIALKTLELKPGDEVIVPSFTIISCVTAIIEAHGTPILVDCDPYTFTLDPIEVERKINSRTKAILAVHMYGHPVDLSSIVSLCKKNKLYLIEDTAQGLGAKYKGNPCGSFGTISILSFYANKLITTGEGGMILTSSSKIEKRARALKNLYFKKTKRFEHDKIGYNFRMTNLQAAIGVAQFEKIDKFILKKRKIARIYEKTLKSLPFQLPIEKKEAQSVFWMYAILLKDKLQINSKTFAELLFKKGIQTRPFFLGMHQQPIFKKMNLFKNEKFPVTEKIYKKGLYLPSGLNISSGQILKVCNAIKETLYELGKN